MWSNVHPVVYLYKRIGKMIAVPVQQMVFIAFIISTHLFYNLSYIIIIKIRFSNIYGFSDKKI